MITKKNDSQVAVLPLTSTGMGFSLKEKIQVFKSEVEMRDEVDRIHYSEQNKQDRWHGEVSLVNGKPMKSRTAVHASDTRTVGMRDEHCHAN